MTIDQFLLDISSVEKIINLLIQSFVITALVWGITVSLKKSSPPLRSRIIVISLIIITAMAFILPFAEILSPAHKIVLQEIEISVAAKAAADNNFSSTISIEDLIFVTWLSGSLFMFIKLALGIRKTVKLVNSAIPFPSKRLNLILTRSLARFSDIKFRGIYISDLINSPVSAGFFSPLIIIPESMIKESGEQEIAAILDHELSHIYHRDQFTGLIQRITAAIYWWNPFVHMLNRNLSGIREHIADNYAISRSTPLTYAKYLTALAEKALIARKETPGILNFSSAPMSIKERIVEIVRKERRMETRLKGSVSVITLFIMVALTVSLSGYQIQISPLLQQISSPPSLPVSKAAGKSQPKQAIRRVSSYYRPKLIKKVAPVYPAEALKQRVSGNVLLEATTDISGRIRTLKVISGNPLLNNSAIAAVKRWIYEPYIVNRKPVPVKFTVNVTYSLSNDGKKKRYTISKK